MSKRQIVKPQPKKWGPEILLPIGAPSVYPGPGPYRPRCTDCGRPHNDLNGNGRCSECY